MKHLAGPEFWAAYRRLAEPARELRRRHTRLEIPALRFAPAGMTCWGGVASRATLPEYARAESPEREEPDKSVAIEENPHRLPKP
jgi:hypothetical protein